MTSSTNDSTVADPAAAAAAAPKDMRAYRAPSLLQPHRARDALRDAHEGKIAPLMAFFLMLATPPMAKVVAQLGYDVVMIDHEHSAMNIETMTQMVQDIQHISEGKTIAWVRVSGHDHATIGYALDAGASIMVPQVETVEEAQHVVSAAKFGRRTKGTRSAPPGRWVPGFSDGVLRGGLTLWENLNHQAAVVIQVETEAAVRNLDAILAAVGEHIDAVWIGMLDCRVSMGLPGFWGDEEEWMDVVKTFRETLRKHDMPCAGMALGPPEFMRMLGQNNAMSVVGQDVFAIVEAGVKVLGVAREMFPMVDMSTTSTAAMGDEEIESVAPGRI